MKGTELGFHMETYVFLDRENERISFLAPDSKGGMGHGHVAVSESGIVYSGTSYFPGGSVEFRKTFELIESGELRDRFHRKTKDGSWTEGHLIEYRTRPKGPGSE